MTNLLTPYIGGDAVYSARIMLGIDPDDYGLPFAKPPQMLKLTEISNRLYPNPATETVNVSLIGFEEIKSVLVELYDITGQKTANFSLYADNYNFSVANLKAGMYMYRLIVNGELIENNKLVIIK